MANKNIFGKAPEARETDTVNEAGGKAYKLSPEHALAQVAITGTLYPTFYMTDKDQTDQIVALANEVSPLFLSQCAIYAREKGYMKDTPALLLAILSARAKFVPEAEELVASTFKRVVDNGKMLRTFVQIVRSGISGRKNLGTKLKNLIREFLHNKDAAYLLRASVGKDPSLADIIKMVHPVPRTAEQRGTYAYLIGKPLPENSVLSEFIGKFEAFRQNREGDVPKVPFQLLDNMELSAKEWAEVIKNGGWHFVRMNLNTFARHKVYAESGMTDLIADMLKNPEAIRNSKVFPYQLFTAFKALSSDVPMKVKLALQDAMEIAIANVPTFAGTVAVCPDTSGSMQFSVTGNRGTATSATACVDVAALVSASVMRNNPEAIILPFDTSVHIKNLNPRDSVLTNAAKLALMGGGTDVSSPLRYLLEHGLYPDLVIIVSDNESWFQKSYTRRSTTEAMRMWGELKKKNKKAKLVCIDIQPTTTSQADNEDPSILSVGGFSDNVFTVIANFASGNNVDKWVEDIKKI